ncbi:MAG: hypothetical protein N3F63_06555 [Thermoplasmata archaeon]|nr:hypothetical protein [Thermoplasmata archaeon]
MIDEITPAVQEVCLKERYDLCEFKKYCSFTGKTVFLFDAPQSAYPEATHMDRRDEELNERKQTKPRSKYAHFGEEKLLGILELLEDAYKRGVSQEIDVTKLSEIGERTPENWVGSVRF